MWKVKTANGVISSPQTTVAAPEDLHSAHTQLQDTPTDPVANVPDTELHAQANNHPLTGPHFRRSIAVSDLSRADYELRSLQNARSQVPTMPRLSPEEAGKEALEGERAVADRMAKVGEKSDCIRG